MYLCSLLIPPNPPLKKGGKKNKLKKGEKRISLEKGGKKEGFSLEKGLPDQKHQTFPPFLKGD
ncbi:MAG: hypothetical protein JETT_3650 [Candidatus Jettenia ecosi]|uniref:Uncharacterized protein n=1 Tax=Candidatus Jettenia ecosi TaxID=2494326 RepID=A0A533Q679_9BACT|nr:MAG: hypothetical protein JETT_3650 [Candidatus Jettenia ecosi]